MHAPVLTDLNDAGHAPGKEPAVAALHFDKNLIVLLEDDDLDTFNVEERLADMLYEGGWVKPSYKAALHAREEEFPTGLDAVSLGAGFNVAVPHCDPEHVEHGAICVGVLKNPVSWRRMDDPSKSCHVSLVVMLALDEAHAHLEMLQKVMSLVQDDSSMSKIVGAESADEAYELLKFKLS